MDNPTAVIALNALSHDTRLAAFRALVQAGPDGLPVGELRERLDLPAATLTAHLNVLRAAGLARDERQGRSIRVRAEYPRMNALIAYLTENCCAGAELRPAGDLQAQHAAQEDHAMNRFHVHLNVADLDASIRFYSELFARAADRAQARLRQVDARGPARELRDFRHRSRARHRPPRHPGRIRRGARRAGRAARCRRRQPGAGGSHRVLLRALGQAVDRGPAGHALGNLPHPRRSDDLPRRRRRLRHRWRRRARRKSRR